MAGGFFLVVPIVAGFFWGLGSGRAMQGVIVGAAIGLVLFFIVHIAMVVLAGPYNEVRSMISGRYRLPREREPSR